MIEVADGDGVDHDIFLAKPVYSCAPGLGVIFAVGENDDGPPFGVLFGTESVAGRIKGSTEIRAPRIHDSGPQFVQRIQYGTEVFRQRTPDDSTAGECHHGHAVARFTRQSVDQAFGRFNRRSQAIWNRVFNSHAPTDVDQEHDVVPGR
jgi:hypothetical protein